MTMMLIVHIFRDNENFDSISITPRDNLLYDLLTFQDEIGLTGQRVFKTKALTKKERKILEFHHYYDLMEYTEIVDAKVLLEILEKLIKYLRPQKNETFKKKAKFIEKHSYKNHQESENEKLLMSFTDLDHECGILIGILRVAALMNKKVRLFANFE